MNYIYHIAEPSDIWTRLNYFYLLRIERGRYIVCKIACITKITDETSENAKKFIKAMSKTMSVNDHDGWGYAAVDSTGNLFGERWKNPDHAFCADAVRANVNAKEAIQKFKGFLKVKDVPPIQYNTFGELGEGLDTHGLRAAILHARSATAPNVMINTHPFVSGDTALIHNGCIRNTEELVMKTSSCDSECILNKYVEKDVTNNVNNISQMAADLQGYYACGVLSKNANGLWLMDVFRDRSANLTAFFVQELNCIVIATPGINFNNQYTQNGYGPVPSACRQLGFTITEEYEVKTASLVRVDVASGEIIENIDFDSSYKEKPKKGNKQNKHNGGRHGRRQASYPDRNIYDGAVEDKWIDLFGDEQNGKNTGKRTWSERQKDEDMDRFLSEEVTGASHNANTLLPAGPTKPDAGKIERASEIIKAFEGEFKMDDETGGWHRVATDLDGTNDE